TPGHRPSYSWPQGRWRTRVTDVPEVPRGDRRPTGGSAQMSPAIPEHGGPAAGDETTGALEREAFTGVFRRHPAGVAVVTLLDDGRPVGFTATSLISVSAQPPIF